MNKSSCRGGTWLFALAALLLVGLVVARLLPWNVASWQMVVAEGVFLFAVAGLGSVLMAGTATSIAATQAEFAALEAEVQVRQEKLAEVANLEGRFVGNIAHEIKTPLAIALVQIDLLRKCSADPSAVLAHAKGIGEDLRHLGDLVDSFLRLARPFAQAETSGHVHVPLHDVVVDAARRSQSLARELGIKVVLRLAEAADEDDPVEVMGDAVLLEAMLENLLRNAVRFAPRGSQVDVRVTAQDHVVLLSVSDLGAGVPVENVEAVFDWFFQAPGRSPPSSGTGFGLAIARRVAEHHGGSISLRNQPGGGCEFEVSLPRSRVESDPDSGTAAPHGPRLVQPD